MMIDDFSLKVRTPASWCELVLNDPLALLNDHAYLEKKAAMNALELLNRWPDPKAPKKWVTILSGIARDETVHLSQVTRLLARKGGGLERTHHNPYANALHGNVRKGDGTRELLDRLLISAIIEARSCERFELLSNATNDAELKKLYGNLKVSEQGHYKVFVTLSNSVRPTDEVRNRWEELSLKEGQIITEQPLGSKIHSGWK
jgi:tRNA 2-(methylsulfanyl)-N6-isopentenyladenosine37 hydroxylase